ncbi:MAG TPA: mechanosensitive ion channel domain-containing protein, partial [Ignavibacteriales bacterium]|nr:mechanosensitive ion channel domain-containing protein [Ignavibacteriales bacterium]
MIDSILHRVYFENSVLDYLIALGIFFIALIAVKIFAIIILKRLKIWSEKTKTNFDDFVIEQVEKSAVPALYVASIFPAKNYLIVKPSIDLILNGILLTIITFYAIRALIAFLNYSIQVYSTRRDPQSVSSMKGISTFISIFVWGLGLVFLLGNLGYDVSAIIAGLGIGGIAIALAAQAVLGDLFSYFVIFFDKPFQIGDFIIVDNKMGTIEKIGIKTTRVRSLSGEEIIFPNKNLTDSRVHNYKRMEKRRIE